MFKNKVNNKGNSLTSELNLYKIFWIFVFFSIYGFVFETIQSLIKFGGFYNRQGLLYGPFSQIYGLGAVIIILCTKNIYKKSIAFLFILSCFMGAAFEYLFSLMQEMIFGCVSWNYYSMPFNIQGRINLLYSLIWGVIGVIIVRWLYPLTIRMIKSITNKKGIIISWIVLIFLCYDIFISASAVRREFERFNNIPPSNKFQVYLDEKYPDSFMKTRYPSMIFK